VQTKLLHLIGNFFQPAILQDMSGNSVKISKTYFQNCTASSNPVWSASKSIDIAERVSSICATFPTVSVSIRENSKLRARIARYFSD